MGREGRRRFLSLRPPPSLLFSLLREISANDTLSTTVGRVMYRAVVRRMNAAQCVASQKAAWQLTGSKHRVQS
jgi:hypothetical protein